MKRFTLALLAIASCFAAEGYALGPMQGRHCNSGCDQFGPDYRPTQWNGGHRTMRQSANQCRKPSGSRLVSLWTRPLFPRSCAAKCCATKAFPDAGWSPPAHFPVNYDGGWYGSYLPQHAYGTPGGGFVASYPSVYQPTDTTQLGYSYNKVPTWQTRYDMTPPVPIPGNFHNRACPNRGGGCNSGYGTAYAPARSSCQSCNSGNYSAGPQYTLPAGHQVVRSSGPQRQGLLGGFRLASMTEVFD
ncbi:MAG: hypothetical protein O2856_09340 [Planctomycetota bacterium]|nr:hypothetical protein [Planctomycetota bacterium]